MQKIKSVFYSISTVAMLAPTVALAQWDPGNASSSDLADTSIGELIMLLMQWLLYIVAFLAVIGFVISGILYITAAGDEDQIAKAKKALIYSIIGILVALIGLVIVTAVDTFLGGSNRF